EQHRAEQGAQAEPARGGREREADTQVTDEHRGRLPNAPDPWLRPEGPWNGRSGRRRPEDSRTTPGLLSSPTCRPRECAIRASGVHRGDVNQRPPVPMDAFGRDFWSTLYRTG